ncbi:MAG: hypothetical protein K1X94_34085, partial [Sandaracinaceae bacterium]|nr:hypothetical protein [Sandaracinaceae bacterium]
MTMRERWRGACVAIALACCGCRSALATQIAVSVDTDLVHLEAVRVRVLYGCVDGAPWLGTGDGRLAEGRAALPTECRTLGEGRSVAEEIVVSDPSTGLPAGALSYRLVSDRVFARPEGPAAPGCDDVLTALPLTLTVLPPHESACRDRLPYLVVEAIGIPSAPSERAYYSARQATFVPGASRTLSLFLTDCACRVGTTCDAIGRCVPVAEADPVDAGVADAGSCAPGYGDCDASPGCETRVSDDPAHCGTCERACGGTEVCFEGACTTAPCLDGDELCDGHCVSTASDPEHCGGCHRACRIDQSCEHGGCTGGSPCPDGLDPCGADCVSLAATHQSRGCGTCDDGWADCTTGPGCETQLGTPTACRTCDESCVAVHSTTCTVAGCAGCEAGWDDCDAMAPGCETPLGSLRACHGCAENCAGAHLTTCDIVSVPGGCSGPCEPGWLSCEGRGIGCAVPAGTMSDCSACGEDCNALHTLACT